MNWIKLKEKFPNSYEEIREFYNNSVVKDSTLVLEMFLKYNGFKVGHTFIDSLKIYELKNKQINIKKNDLAKSKGFENWDSFLLDCDKSKKHHNSLNSFWKSVFENKTQ
jgi:hypothetical protein